MYQQSFNYIPMVFDQRFIVFEHINDFSLKIIDSHQQFTGCKYIND